MQETQETRVQSLGWEDPLEKQMATHSSIFAWEIPWTEEAGGLQSMDFKESYTTEQLNIMHSLDYNKEVYYLKSHSQVFRKYMKSWAAWTQCKNDFIHPHLSSQWQFLIIVANPQ